MPVNALYASHINVCDIVILQPISISNVYILFKQCLWY